MALLLALITVPALAPTAQAADGDFAPAGLLSTGGVSPQSVAIGDFNGDGDEDLAVSNASGTVAIMLGAAGGAFGSPTLIATGTGNRAVVTADFDADGALDLAVVNGISNNVAILLGNGDGTFTAAASAPVGGVPFAAAVGDFDGDSVPDLAVTNTSTSNVSILLGNGDGTFTAAAPVPAANPFAVAVGDLDGDGDADLAVVNTAAQNVSIRLGNGDGTFTVAAESPATGTLPSSVAIADFDADGIPDLTVANSGLFGSASILLGDGDGTFTPADPVSAGFFSSAVAVGDFNADGTPDLAVANTSQIPVDGDVSILLGNGDGTFTPASAPAGAAYSPVAVAVGDFNADSDPDLVVVNRDSDNVTILLGTGSPVLAPTFAIDPLGHSFGEQPVGTSSDAQTFTVSNDGTADLDISATELNGADPDQYAFGTNTCAGQSIAPGTTCTVEILFEPTSTGDKNAGLLVSHNAISGGGQVILTGFGSSAPALSLDPDGHDYGPQVVDTTSDVQVFTVTNTGASELTIAATELEGAEPDQFIASADTCTGQGIAPATACTVQISFAPTSTGDKAAVLTFTHDADSSPDEVALTGTGTPTPEPTFSVTPVSNDFDDQTVGTTSVAQTFTVTNTGVADLALTGAELNGTDAGEFDKITDTCSGESLATDGTCVVEVAFAPTGAGDRTADLTFTHNGATSPDQVALTGTGTPADQDDGGVVHRCLGEVATIVGTEGDDTLYGTPGPDVIVALGGDDVVYGLGGDDLICLGDGDDVAFGGPGDDWIRGGRATITSSADPATTDSAAAAATTDSSADPATIGSGAAAATTDSPADPATTGSTAVAATTYSAAGPATTACAAARARTVSSRTGDRSPAGRCDLDDLRDLVTPGPLRSGQSTDSGACCSAAAVRAASRISKTSVAKPPTAPARSLTAPVRIVAT